MTIEELTKAIGRAGASFSTITERGSDIYVGLARDGMLGVSTGCLIISKNTLFCADDIAHAIAAYQSALEKSDIS